MIFLFIISIFCASTDENNEVTTLDKNPSAEDNTNGVTVPAFVDPDENYKEVERCHIHCSLKRGKYILKLEDTEAGDKSEKQKKGLDKCRLT